MTNPDNMITRIFIAKYFSQGDFLEAALDTIRAMSGIVSGQLK